MLKSKLYHHLYLQHVTGNIQSSKNPLLIGQIDPNPRKYTNMIRYSVCAGLWSDREMAQNEMVSQISCDVTVIPINH